MNNQNIKSVSLLITKNYSKILFVSKYLFQQVRINDKYLNKVYNYINSRISNGGIFDIVRVKYFLELYEELLSLNHKFSNAIFSRLHDLDYRNGFELDLDTIKVLSDFGLINRYNFNRNSYNDNNYELLKYLISVNTIDIYEIMDNACKDNNLKLAKILIEELNMKLTCENSIYRCNNNINIEFIKYLFSKLPKHELDYQKIIIKVFQDYNSRILKYLLEDLNIIIEKSTIMKMFDRGCGSTVINLIKDNYVIVDEEIFNKAIEVKNLFVVEHIYRNYGYNISKKDKHNLLEYYITLRGYESQNIRFFLLEMLDKNEHEID